MSLGDFAGIRAQVAPHIFGLSALVILDVVLDRPGMANAWLSQPRRVPCVGIALGKESAAMATTLRTGEMVRWNWGSGHGEGRIVQRFERRVQRTIEGAKVIKNGSSENPAFLLEQEDGGKVLKLSSELSRGK
ncbi:hypervirulence associated TUDOR domain-containing protein [Sphingosinicella rhizophila]|uniref:DUF2945 domain-containing protein n=1 Tax=Sphingosinicella rhizophila TaxID=3050082 RepID=A0ABU3QB07_9SPHN|nr:DUF2945 domain-containing protein [Sphingosinicella sp. GR2756]MDT9600554.1 DUF2945 domain-containing protein [Sphingosinicella sp. GR2756]